ncbi:MAG TPA: DoxX family membrane protein [Candidatus Eisenbacteria bacterium]|nr:DoxX family membrane protein [Candidatus Eisenbacteria bacterium]
MSPIGATILRVLLGCTYLAHAYYIWAVLTPEALADLVDKQTGLSIGGNFVWYQLVAHVLGGFMLVPGIATRWAVAANIPALLASLIVLHFHEGYSLHATVVEAARNTGRVAGYEYTLFVLVATIAQFFLGTGALGFSRDR